MNQRPDPVRCVRCNGFVFGPATGESAEIVKRISHSKDADPHNLVCACGQCGYLYEVRMQAA